MTSAEPQYAAWKAWIIHFIQAYRSTLVIWYTYPQDEKILGNTQDVGIEDSILSLTHTY